MIKKIKRIPMYSYKEYTDDGKVFEVDRYPPSWYYLPHEFESRFTCIPNITKKGRKCKNETD